MLSDLFGEGATLTDIVLAQWDGKEEAIEGGNGSQEEEAADILRRGCHQAELVHRWHSRNEERRETSCRRSGGLDCAVFFGTEVATTEVGRQHRREWL